MAMKTKDPKWIDSFISRLEKFPQELDPTWFTDIFGCCESYENVIWEPLLPTVSKIIADETVPASVRINMGSFFRNRYESWRGPIFPVLGFHTKAYLWPVMKFLFDAVSGDIPGLDSYNGALATELLFEFDVAAAHVAAHIYLGNESMDDKDKKRVREFIKRISTNYPILNNEPSEEIFSFWKNDQLVERLGDYEENGTNVNYRRLNP